MLPSGRATPAAGDPAFLEDGSGLLATLGEPGVEFGLEALAAAAYLLALVKAHSVTTRISRLTDSGPQMEQWNRRARSRA